MGWEDEWVDAAEAIVRDEYERKYANRTTGGSNNVNDEVIPSPKKKRNVRIYYLFSWLYLH